MRCFISIKFSAYLLIINNFRDSDIFLLYRNVTEGRFRDVFPTTVKMSSYLLAFIVSNYSSTDQLGIHRVFAKPQEINAGHGQYALQTGQTALNAIADFVNVPYSLEKMDQAAVPDDYFYFGAMENWGLVI